PRTRLPRARGAPPGPARGRGARAGLREHRAHRGGGGAAARGLAARLRRAPRGARRAPPPGAGHPPPAAARGPPFSLPLLLPGLPAQAGARARGAEPARKAAPPRRAPLRGPGGRGLPRALLRPRLGAVPEPAPPAGAHAGLRDRPRPQRDDAAPPPA